MNVAVALSDVRPELATSEAGPAPKPVVVAFGFWIFLLSDIVMFATLFAAYAVLARATDGGPSGVQLFSQTSVAIETACLLASSYTCGPMSLAVKSRRHLATYFGAFVTFTLGLAFLALELREFADMIARDAGPQRNAFLSAFFTLVGCHGLHVLGRAGLAGRDDGPGGPQRLSFHRAAPPGLLRPVLARARPAMRRQPSCAWLLI